MSKNQEPEPAVITTTTVTSETVKTTQISGSTVPAAFDKSFFKSPQGILGVLEILYSLSAFIVVVCGDRSYNKGAFNFFLTVTFVVFFFTLCSYLGQLSHLRYKVQIPWTMVDVFVYIIYILLLLISSSIVAAKGYSAAHGSGATLGFVVMQMYLLSLGLAIAQYRLTQAMNDQSGGARGADNMGTTLGEPDFFPGAGNV